MVEFQQATKNLDKQQEAALDKILKLQAEIEKIKTKNEKEIGELLRKNNINRIDVSEYSRKKQKDKLLNFNFE